MSTPQATELDPTERWCDDVRFVRALARRLVRDANLADDIAQDVWLRVLRDRARPPERVRAWLATVVRNLVSSHHRHERVAQQSLPALALDAANPSDPAAAVARLESHQLLLSSVRALDEPYRSAIVQRYFEGLTPKAIAQRTGEPVRTVHTRLQRGLTQLRGRLHERDARWPAALVCIAYPSRATAAFLTMVSTTKVMVCAAVCVAVAAAIYLTRTEESTTTPITMHASAARGDDAAVKTSGTEPSHAPAAMARTAVEVPPSSSSTPNAIDAPNDERWIVAGVVLDTSGTPLPDVSVIFEVFGHDTAHARATSRQGGSFELELPTVAGGHVGIDDPAWTAVYRPVLWGQPDVGERELTVVATPCAPVRGEVVDETGQPISGATVSVSGTAPQRASFTRNLESTVPGEWRADTDPRGRFEIERAPVLPDMRVSASRSGYHSRHDTLVDRDRVRIVLQRGEVLVGRVVDEHGEPVEAAVFCHPAGTMSDASGRFELDISGVSDRWLVAARDGNLPARLQCTGQPSNLVASWPREIELRLGHAPLTIRGRVLTADGRSLGAMRVTVADSECLIPGNPFSAVEFLARVHSRVTEHGAEFSERSVADLAAGEFEVRGLQRRAYRLDIEDRESLLAFTTGPIQAGSSGVIVQLPDETIWPAVKGVVVDRRGDPVAGATIYFEIPAEEDRAARQTDALTTDEHGRFVRGPVVRAAAKAVVQAPGIAVPTRLDIGTSADAESLRLAAPVRTNVRIVTTRPADSAAFFDAAGAPVFATITQGNMAWGAHAIPLTGGASEFIVVPDDAVTLVLSDKGNEVLRIAVDLRPGEAQVLRP